VEFGSDEWIASPFSPSCEVVLFVRYMYCLGTILRRVPRINLEAYAIGFPAGVGG